MTDISVAATASILPETVVSNRDIGEKLIAGTTLHIEDESAAELVAQTRTRAELIEKKTGLRARRFFRPEQTPTEVGTDLLNRLMGNRSWGDLQAIIVSSSSSHGFPGISQQIVARARKDHPELTHPFVLDIGSNACTGFMYALTVGASLIRGMGYERVACMAVEFSSRCIAYDPLAFGTSTLFGDAAAGVVLTKGNNGIASLDAVRATSMLDEQTINLIKGSGMEAAQPALEVPTAARWFMAGPPVAIGATKILVEEIRRYQSQGVQVDWLIPHQANLTRILIPACKTVEIDPSRLCASFAETGNTSSASIPLLLDDLVRSDRAKPGDRALMVGFGASFAVGSALLTLNNVPAKH
jgi:3-oxoacyl-[acyl-carrier-protein] synthase III